MPDTAQEAEATREAIQLDEAQLTGEVAGADGGPSDSEDMRAADRLRASPEVAANYRASIEQAAATKGEGRAS